MKSQNFVASLVAVVAPPGADTEFTVAHELSTPPTGMCCVRRSSNASLYWGTTAWDATNAYIKSDAGSVQYLVLFFA